MGRANRRQSGGPPSDSRPLSTTSLPTWTGLALIIWIGLVYAPSFTNGFTYDDPTVVTDASRLLGDPARLPALFSSDYFRLSGESTYRPVVTLTYMLDWHIAGGAAWAFHVQSVVWHLIAVATLLSLLGRMGASDPVRYLAGALFGLHPAVTEAVYAIGFREDVLVTALGLLALRLFTDDAPAGAGWRRVLGGVVLAGALLSKESAVVLIALLPLTNWAIAEVRARGSWAPRREANTYALAAAVTVAYLVVRFALLPAHDSYGNRIGNSVVASIATGAVAAAYYLRLLVLPVPLCADYRGVIPYVTSIGDWRPWLAVALIGTITWFAWNGRRDRPLVLWGWVWFLVALAPVSNLVPIPTFMAERFLHLPFVGLTVCMVGLLEPVLREIRSTRLAAVVALLPVAAASGLTWQRHHAWLSDETLWGTTLRDHPAAHGALHGYGSSLIARGRYADGMVYLRQLLSDPTIERDRRSAAASELGAAYERLGQSDAARQSYEQAVAAAPDRRARLGLAMMYFREDRLDEARMQVEALLREQPDAADAYSVLGGILLRQGQRPAALAAWSQSVVLDPTIAASHANIGVSLGAMGRTTEGIAALQKALSLDPTQAAWHLELARLLMRTGERGGAMQQLEEALRVDPGFTPARDALQELVTR